ncbi:hypothetical protein [Conexibacter arvalis]|uniref:PKD domain-containing protein n=1 Tax=Conexibacter arvalis TaxID=912552 RepID=A0A840IK82_9ACTN|nr:hypothetical protein [Conexibacter arvalis]MBB4664735.1 hypothetical protein [Conexibacter arvalis]
MHAVPDRTVSRRALLAAVAAVALIATLLAAAPARAGLYTGELIFGPHGGLRTIGNLDITSDGTGAIVYTVDEGGGPQVYVSRLVDGAWSGPERVDAGLPGGSSNPHVSTSPGGRVVVSYANGGNIYAASRAPGAGGWTVQAVWGSGGASEPWVDLGVNGKAYLVFAAPGAGGHDVRIAYSKNSAPFELLGAPLDANPAADAGAGDGRPRVGSAASGAAIVAWGESGTVVARRVVGLRPSVAHANAADGFTLEGLPPVGFDQPEVAVQDDDAFAGVTTRAHFDVNGSRTTRAVYHRFRGSRFEWRAVPDAAPFGSGRSSSGARMSNTGVGQGLVIATDDVTNLTTAIPMKADLAPTAPVQVDSLAASTAPTFPVTGTATPLKMMVAWQYTGPDGATDVRGRFYNGREFEAEQVLSRPELGPTAAGRGISAAGDDDGDIAVAWIQDVPGQGPAIVSAVIDQPPTRLRARAQRVAWERTATPTLAWTPARESWGVSYKVVVDGVEVVTTPRSSFRLRTPVADGLHSWSVTAVDRRGQTLTAPAGTFRVDTVAPTARARLTGAKRPGSSLRLTLRPSDPPPPVAAGAAPAKTSGVASVIVDWGDRSRRERVKRGARHAYARAGRYTIRITVADKAGNKAVVRQVVKIAAPRRGGRGDARARAADAAAARLARTVGARAAVSAAGAAAVR